MATNPRRITVTYDPLDDLAGRLRAENPKLHDLGAIGASYSRYGYIDPVVVNDTDGLVLAGHGRIEELLALQAAGSPTPEGVDLDQNSRWLVPTIHGVHLGPADARGFLIAANRTVELGGWDPAKLAQLLTELVNEGESLDGVGFSEQQLAELLASLHAPAADGLTDPDDVASLPAHAEVYVQPGDLWALGPHRLLCGDATSATDMATLLGDERAAMCATDPPWNVAIGQDSNPRHRQRPGLLNDNLPTEEFADFLRRFAANLRPHLVGDLYCVLGTSGWPLLDTVLRENGFHWSSTLVWVKQHFVLGRSKYHRRFEPVWFGWPTPGRSSFCGGRSQDDVWEIDRPMRSEEHPTMKPVALIERMIANSSRPGQVVLDPFVGSGTGLIAAERLRRRCFAMELDPAYAQVSIERWRRFSGKTPQRLDVRP